MGCSGIEGSELSVMRSSRGLPRAGLEACGGCKHVAFPQALGATDCEFAGSSPAELTVGIAGADGIWSVEFSVLLQPFPYEANAKWEAVQPRYPKLSMNRKGDPFQAPRNTIMISRASERFVSLRLTPLRTVAQS